MKPDHRLRRSAILSLLVWATAPACGGAGAAAVPDAGGASIRVIRGDPGVTDWLNLTIEGAGLSGLEGRLVRARIGLPARPPERLASGEGHVAGGAFTFSFPAVLQKFLYVQKLLFIDVDGDGVCSAGSDRVYHDSRATQEDLTLSLVDSVPAATPDLQMPRSFDAAPHCDFLNQPWPED